MRTFSPAMDHIYKKVQYHIDNLDSKGNDEITALFIEAADSMNRTFQKYFEEMNAVVDSDISRRIKINILQSIHLTFDDLFDDFDAISDILGSVVYHKEFSSFISNILDTKYKRCLAKL